MARSRCKIGFVTSSEVVLGVHSEVITEQEYTVDVIRDSRRLDTGSNITDDITLGNQFSVVGTKFALENFHTMRYLVWKGLKWKIKNVEIVVPRLILTLGEIFNVQ